MTLNQFINTGADNVTVNDMKKSIAREEDLQKAMNKAGLVQKEVQVKGKNGQMFTRKQWVKANDTQSPTPKQPSSKNNAASSSKSSKFSKGKQQLASMLASGKSRDDIMAEFEKQGVTWKKNDHAGINWMRASMAIQKHLNSSSKSEKIDSGEKKSLTSDRVYLQHSGGTQQQKFQAAREYLESHPISLEDAKKSVSVIKDQKKASSLFAKNSLLKGNLVIERGGGKEPKTYFGQIEDSIVQELTNNIPIEDSMKVETKRGTLTVGELRPYLSEVNTVLDTPYKAKAVVVQAEKGALSKKVGTITSGGNTYDIYDSASDNYNVMDETPRYYVAVNTSAPKGLARYKETLLRDLCSTEIAKGGQITKKQAEKALAGFGIEWDKDSLDKYESGYKATKEDSEKIASKIINPSSKSFKAEATKVYHELVLRDWMIANTGGNKQSKAGK